MRYLIREKFIDSLIVFMLVMSTGGLLFVFNRNISYLGFIILLLMAFLFFGKKLSKKKLNTSILTLLSVYVLFIVNYLFAVNEQSGSKYMYYLMVISVSVMTVFHFFNNRSFKVLLDIIYSVLKFIMLYGILNFLAFFLIKNNLTTITSTYHECETFLNVFFYTTERGIVNLFGIEFCRNQGLFWEPGVYQAFLNIFFFLEAFVFKRNRVLLVLTAFVVLTTYSTTGLALLMLQGLVYLFAEGKNNRLIFPILLLVSLPIYMVFSLNVEEKVQGDKEASFQKRMFDLTQPLFIALEHPLTGIGLDIEQFQKMRKEFHFNSHTLQALQEEVGFESKVAGTDKGSSNSVMFLFATMGFPTALLLLYMFFKQKIIEQKRWLIILIMIISVMSEPLLLRPFFFIFIISGFMHLYFRITSNKQVLL